LIKAFSVKSVFVKGPDVLHSFVVVMMYWLVYPPRNSDVGFRSLIESNQKI